MGEKTGKQPGQVGVILDSTALENLRKAIGGDAAFLADLIDTFLDDAPQLLADMHDAAEQGDAERLRIAAHSLKSNSADFGATSLYNSSKELEAMGKAGALAGAAELVAQAETEYERVKAALEAVRTDQ